MKAKLKKKKPQHLHPAIGNNKPTPRHTTTNQSQFYPPPTIRGAAENGAFGPAVIKRDRGKRVPPQARVAGYRQQRVCAVSPRCGSRSCPAAPVGTLRPGSGPCRAAGAEPRRRPRGGTGAGSRSGTPTPGPTSARCRSTASGRRTQPAGTRRRGPRPAEPNRRS